MRICIDGYTLTPAAASDRDYVVGCIRKTVLESVSKEEAAMSDMWIDGILSIVTANLRGEGELKNEAFVLKRKGGKRCGMLWMGESKDQYTCDDTGYIIGIYVDEELRGLGLGKALMDAAEQWCAGKGFMSVTLNVGLWNKGARDLYESVGFRERSTVMRKDLQR